MGQPSKKRMVGRMACKEHGPNRLLRETKKNGLWLWAFEPDVVSE